MDEFSQATNDALSVSSYITRLNRSLSAQGGRVKGEVTSVKVYPKTVYFDIKDDVAVLGCMMWLNSYHTNGIELKAGDEIIVTGVPNVYPASGKMSFMANTIEYAGEGALKQAYDRLKKQLEAEGLLSADRKRSMPEFPRKIGLITSMRGVVIQDFSTNLSRHGFKIKTIDSRVEGKDAIHDLLASISTMRKQDIDVLVIIRGGGSLESLQAFNTESIVRAIANFKVPVITGIGHDVDETLSQLVADIGVSTPTAVAEVFNAPWDGLNEALSLHENKILGHFRSALRSRSQRISADTNNIFRTYERQLSDTKNRINTTSTKLTRAFHSLSRRVRNANAALLRVVGIMRTNMKIKVAYLRRAPNKIAANYRANLNTVNDHMTNDATIIIRKQRKAQQDSAKSIQAFERSIKNNDPTRNIKLGYSISYIGGKIARNIADLSPGQVVTTRLIDGEFTSEIKELK